MDIAALSRAMSAADLTNKAGALMMKKSMETVEQVGDGIVKMMEASVVPNLGQNIDVSV